MVGILQLRPSRGISCENRCNCAKRTINQPINYNSDCKHMKANIQYTNDLICFSICVSKAECRCTIATTAVGVALIITGIIIYALSPGSVTGWGLTLGGIGSLLSGLFEKMMSLSRFCCYKKFRSKCCNCCSETGCCNIRRRVNE
jgi:hypothetical protein